jgi:hypothetical protein
MWKVHEDKIKPGPQLFSSIVLHAVKFWSGRVVIPYDNTNEAYKFIILVNYYIYLYNLALKYGHQIGLNASGIDLDLQNQLCINSSVCSERDDNPKKKSFVSRQSLLCCSRFAKWILSTVHTVHTTFLENFFSYMWLMGSSCDYPVPKYFQYRFLFICSGKTLNQCIIK